MSTTELPSSFDEVTGPQAEPDSQPAAVEAAKRGSRSRRRPAGHGAPADKEAKPAGKASAAEKQAKPAKGAKAAKPAKGSGQTVFGIEVSRKSAPVADLGLGAYPIAHLLPPEVVAHGKVRTTRNLMIVLVVVVLLLAVAATGGSYVYAQRAQQQLVAVQGQTSGVLAQESKYAIVRVDQNKVKLAQAAQRVGAAGEVDWDAYFAKVEALLPAGVAVTDISGQTASATAAVTQDSAPLSAGRAAIVTVTVTAPSVTTLANTTDAFRTLPGYAGAVIGALSQSTASASGSGTSGSARPSAGASSWTTTITISLTQAAFSGRFAATK